jgi:hypothetical protein
MGVTAILLTCSYNNQEFFRCGYYINNIYETEEMNLNPPENVEIEKIIRSTLADKPRITKFNIDWDSNTNVIPSYTNFMFNDKISNQNIQDQFQNLHTGSDIKTEENAKEIFYKIVNGTG